MAAFEKHLEGAMPNHFSEIYLVLAKEASSRKQAEDAIASFVLKGEKTPALCLYRFDAEKQNIVAIDHLPYECPIVTIESWESTRS